MKLSNIYLIAAAAFLALSIGMVNKIGGGNSITGAAIGGESAIPVIFVMILSIVFFGLFFLKKAEVANDAKR